MTRRIWFLAGGLILLCVGLTLGPARPGIGQEGADALSILEEQYTLGSGDRIRITVFREEQLSGEFQVDGSGNISYPLIGEVAARGLSLRELEQRLTAKLADGYLVDPRISLEVLNYRPFYILGEVNKPGQYEYVSGITLHNAVALAGGYILGQTLFEPEVSRYLNLEF